MKFHSGEDGKVVCHHDEDVNTKDNYGATVLHKASYCGDLVLVKYLVERGADVNARDEYGQTSLFFALSYGGRGNISRDPRRQEVVKYLKEQGAVE